VGGERRLCGKGELAGSGGERFLAVGGSQLPVECSMLLPMLLEVRKNNYRSYFLTGSQKRVFAYSEWLLLLESA
jgi:hypothetical protein